MPGKASISVFSACTCGLSGRGGFAGGISDVSSWNRTPGFGDFEGGGGDVVLSKAAVESPGSSSKSSGRAVVGDSAPEVVPVRAV